MNESDDLPMIFVDLLEAGSGKREAESLKFGSESWFTFEIYVS